MVGSSWDRVRRFEESRAIHFPDPGMQLDLDGIAAGCAVDVAARSFGLPGVRAGLLELGEVQYAWSAPPGERGWTVAIRDPGRRERRIGTLVLAHRGLAVAGSFARPAGPAGKPFGVAAVADTAGDAQAVASALLALDPSRAGALLQRTRGVEALLLVERQDGLTLLASGSLQGNLALDETWLREIDGRVRYLLPPATLR